MSEKASLNLTAEQLQTLISTAVATAVAEARKPLPPTAEELAAIEQAKKMRQEQGAQELAIQASRQRDRKMCAHRHENGKSATASVDVIGAIVCVKCQAMIKPEPGPFDEPNRFIYDEMLYWTHKGSQVGT